MGTTNISDYACVDIDSFSITQPVAKRYLGNPIPSNTYYQPFLPYPTINVDLLIEGATKLNAFQNWWLNTLDYGTDSFYISLAYHGEDRDATAQAGTYDKQVKFDGNLKMSIINETLFKFNVTLALQETAQTQ